jgi:hypothetical protein
LTECSIGYNSWTDPRMRNQRTTVYSGKNVKGQHMLYSLSVYYIHELQIRKVRARFCVLNCAKNLFVLHRATFGFMCVASIG